MIDNKKITISFDKYDINEILKKDNKDYYSRKDYIEIYKKRKKEDLINEIVLLKIYQEQELKQYVSYIKRTSELLKYKPGKYSIGDVILISKEDTDDGNSYEELYIKTGYDEYIKIDYSLFSFDRKEKREYNYQKDIKELGAKIYNEKNLTDYSFGEENLGNIFRIKEYGFYNDKVNSYIDGTGCHLHIDFNR